MITRRFSIFPGIGPKREQALWEAGIADWRQYLDADTIPGLPDRLRRPLTLRVGRWLQALEQRDVAFFVRNLPQKEHWLLFDEFGDKVRYLDIETTGLSPSHHHVTVVGLYDGHQYQALIRGQGLTSQAIREALGDCKLLVSYYGTAFDVPFLRVAFPDLNWDMAHFDLCFAGRRVGLTGGLKGVERTLGIARDDSIGEVDGYEAVRLWRAYERGNSSALKTLVDYNEADVRNLAQIATIVHERLCQKLA